MSTTNLAAVADDDLKNEHMSADELVTAYRIALRIRLFENKTTELFATGKIKGAAHSYAGEEAIATGVCANLEKDDLIGSYHRGHGHCIAKGGRTDRMMAELMGKRTGYCGGLGGSMHVADLDLGILGANGIVGAAMPLCTGAALASKIRKDGRVAVAFFGDGAINQGVFEESLNLASVWKLPIVFVCENNFWALNTGIAQTTPIERLADRAASYNIPGVRVDGNNLLEVYHASKKAIERARRGDGPTLLEATTYRIGAHSMRGNLIDPRPKDIYDSWMERDPIKRIQRELLDRNILDTDAMAEIGREMAAEIDEAISFGEASENPDINFMMAAVKGVEPVIEEPTIEPGTRMLSLAEALNEALHQEMEADETVIVMGEDIAETGGVFQVTAGLVGRYGADRVRDTPISEATFVGAGVGAAIAGLRPVVELQIFDFVTQAMDMIVNQAAKFRFMLGGKPNVPIVIRGPQGGGIRMAAQHSQSLEAWFAHVPGLTVVAPSGPADAKGLLISAIRSNNPVVFLESKLLVVGEREAVPEQSYAIPLGKGVVKREGKDVTVVATMGMVPRVLAAAKRLARENIDVEVIDPRTIAPLDEELIVQSVRKTNHCVVVHEAPIQGGFGGDIAGIIMEKAFDWLDAPVLRVGSMATPMPFNDELERAVIPSVERIQDAIRSVVNKKL